MFDSFSSASLPEEKLPAMNISKKVVLVEDEVDIVDTIVYNLSREGFETLSAQRGDEGLNLIRKELPDLVVLDLMLPGMDGLTVCQQLKSDPRTSHIPVIIVSAKAEDADIVIGLGLGADDYLGKPFSPRELIARIKVALRHSEKTLPADPAALVFDELAIDVLKHQVTVDGEQIRLTATEFKLLSELAKHPRRAFTRMQLINSALGKDVVIVDRNIDVHIASLRHKLRSASNMIETIRGIGYRFSPE